MLLFNVEIVGAGLASAQITKGNRKSCPYIHVCHFEIQTRRWGQVLHLAFATLMMQKTRLDPRDVHRPPFLYEITIGGTPQNNG